METQLVSGIKPSTHLDRVEWLGELIAWFESVPAAELSRPVPACPAWSIENVIAHVAYGALLFWLVPASHASLGDIDFARLETAVGDGLGARVFSGTLRSLGAVLGSHDPDDRCPVVIGPNTFGNLARLAVSEVGVHRMDCEDALGRPRSMSRPQAVDLLGFTTTTWWPGLAEEAAMPPGRLSLADDAAAHRWVVGEGPDAATIRGHAVDLVASAWGRTSAVVLQGDTQVIDGWTGLTARTTGAPARS